MPGPVVSRDRDGGSVIPVLTTSCGSRSTLASAEGDEETCGWDEVSCDSSLLVLSIFVSRDDLPSHEAWTAVVVEVPFSSLDEGSVTAAFSRCPRGGGFVIKTSRNDSDVSERPLLVFCADKRWVLFFWAVIGSLPDVDVESSTSALWEGEFSLTACVLMGDFRDLNIVILEPS